jgi:CO dehydrogenase/acetyl-CoA synthase beta subunit
MKERRGRGSREERRPGTGEKEEEEDEEQEDEEEEEAEEEEGEEAGVLTLPFLTPICGSLILFVLFVAN